jgi:hypothetical protein
MLLRRITWLHSLAASLALLAMLVPGSVVVGEERVPGTDTPVAEAPEVLVSLNVKQILDSGLVKKYALDFIKMSLQTEKNAQEIIKSTGLDPLKDLDSITISGSAQKPPKAMIVVRGRFDAEKINTRMAKESDKDKSLKSTKDGALTIWQAEKDGNTMYATVASRGMMLMSLDKASLVKAATGLGTGKVGADLKMAMSKVTGKESMWLASIVNADMKTQLASNPQTKMYADKVKAMAGSLTLSDDFHLGAQIFTTDADIAGDIKEKLNGLKPFAMLLAQGNEQAAPVVKELFDNLKITADDTTVNINLKVSEELIKKIQALKPGQ